MMKSFEMRGLALLALCALALWPRQVHASPLFELAGDPHGMGGHQARTVPSGTSAAYFNPALLTESPAALEFGFMLLGQQIALSLDDRPGLEFDVPEGISNAKHLDDNNTPFDDYPVPTRDLELGRQGDGASIRPRPRQAAGTGKQTYAYLTFGILVKLFEERLAVGLVGFAPLADFTRIHAFYNDEREQFFSNSLHPELYGDRLVAPSIAMGVGVKVFEDLSMGVGANLSLKAAANAPAYVANTGHLDDVLVDLDAPVDISLSPQFGATYTLLDKRLRLSAVAHAPSRMDFGVDFTFLVGSGLEQSSGVPLVFNYLPWRVAFGAAFDIIHEANQTLAIAGTLTYVNWHTYVDRHGERPTPAYAWADTISPTVGARYSTGPVRTLLDISYSPTPVPEQTGRSNYVDNDRLSGVLGGEYGFKVFGTDTQIGLQFQTHYLLPRYQEKARTPIDSSGRNLAPELVKDEVPDDAAFRRMPFPGREGLQTNNPGWPGFESVGLIMAGSVYCRLAI